MRVLDAGGPFSFENLYQRSTGTGTGTVPVIFVKQYPFCFGSIGAYGPKTARVSLLYKHNGYRTTFQRVPTNF